MYFMNSPLMHCAKMNPFSNLKRVFTAGSCSAPHLVRKWQLHPIYSTRVFFLSLQAKLLSSFPSSSSSKTQIIYFKGKSQVSHTEQLRHAQCHVALTYQKKVADNIKILMLKSFDVLLSCDLVFSVKKANSCTGTTMS